jgi:hypothetical protein
MDMMNRIAMVLTLAVLACGCRTHAAAPHPLSNGKSPESRFLIGAWTGYVSGLGTNRDSTAEHKAKVAHQFQMLQFGYYSNGRAYLLFKQESGDTPEREAAFREVQEAALMIEKAFIKEFRRPTLLEVYDGINRPNHTSDGIRQPAAGLPKPSR